VPNGTDLVRFAPVADAARRDGRAELGLTEEDEVVLFLGTGFARKGLEPTLRAFALLLATRPGARLLVAGRDRRSALYEDLARTLGIAERVQFLGPRPDPERIYPLADVYVLPTAYDPAANSTLEALACGVPVVTSAMNGAAEVLEPDVHGTVIDNPVVPDELATAMSRWLDEPDRPALRARLRGHAEGFPLDDSCDRILELYRAWCAVETPAAGDER